MKPKKTYLINCVSANRRDIQRMVDRARDITYTTLARHVGAENLKEVFPFYWEKDCRKMGLTLAADWAVSFHKSQYKKIPCYYVRHSGIEYVFV